jgi:predicted dehydrogenase
MLRYHGGARGLLLASQVAVGNENALKLRIYGTTGGLEWAQEDPNYLWFTRFGQPKQLLTRAGAGAQPEAARVSRLPGGHPEGYLEGFATIYAEAARAIRAVRTGALPDARTIYPTVHDGLAGMRFIEAAVASSKAGNVWTKVG